MMIASPIVSICYEHDFGAVVATVRRAAAAGTKEKKREKIKGT
jgi:hypothetical protein